VSNFAGEPQKQTTQTLAQKQATQTVVASARAPQKMSDQQLDKIVAGSASTTGGPNNTVYNYTSGTCWDGNAGKNGACKYAYTCK
jgi:hypothetical protein